MIVFIPCAGTGNRVNHLFPNFNKTLIPYKNKPIISHIIDSYPIDYQFILGLGYKGSSVRDFLETAYTKKKFLFYDVSLYRGKNASLTRTLQEGLNYINEPFIFHANDMIVNYSARNFKKSFAVVDNNNKDFSLYRYFKKNDKEIRLYEKTKIKQNYKNCYPYMGVAFIKEYENFKYIIKNSCNKVGEVDFLKKNKDLKILKCKSFIDFGNPKTIEEINQFNFLEKKDESIYIINNKVIKYCKDLKKNKLKYKRSKLIKDFIPKNVEIKNNFLIYKYQKGNLLNKDYNKLGDFLRYLYEKYWFINYKKRTNKFFIENCYKFYHDKTYSRLKSLKEFDYLDEITSINNIKVKSIFYYLRNINWLEISKGQQCNFHGDLHGSNIIYDKKKFILLDWREKFGNDINTGDVYYDLAKIYHGLIINHDFVSKNYFKVNIKNNIAKVAPKINNNLINGNKKFWEFIEEKEFDKRKIVVITALIFLNISPLHSKHYKSFLFLLGKYILAKNEKFKFVNSFK